MTLQSREGPPRPVDKDACRTNCSTSLDKGLWPLVVRKRAQVEVACWRGHP